MGLSATAGNPQKPSRPNRRKAVRTLFLSPHPGLPGAALLKTHDGIVHSAGSGHPGAGLHGCFLGTTPLGLFVCWACTRGSAPAAQPRALWQNPVGIPGGEMGQGTTLGIPRGETAIALDQRHFHAHNGSSPASFPRPQRQRRCAIQPGVAPFPALPRVQAAARSLPRKGLCRSCTSEGAISKGGMGSGSRVRKRSPPGMYVP